MARSYEEASATRRARLPAETRSDRAVFEQTYRFAVQVMERRELLGLTQIELAEKTSTRATSTGSSVARSSRTRRRFFTSPRPLARNGDWSTSRPPESGSTVGVERRKVLVSDYAPRTRRDRKCRKARTSAPTAAPDSWHECASRVCDAPTPLVLMPMRAASEGPRRAPRSILPFTPSSCLARRLAADAGRGEGGARG
jgi:hypothetical protein